MQAGGCRIIHIVIIGLVHAVLDNYQHVPTDVLIVDTKKYHRASACPLSFDPSKG